MLNLKKSLIGGLLAAGLMWPAGAEPVAASNGVFWTENSIRATGVGRPPQGEQSPGQKRALALRAAQILAYRELAAVVGQVQIVDDTTVDSYAQTRKIQVSGLVQGARMLGEPVYHADGSVSVTLELPIFGAHSLASQLQFAELLKNRRKPAPAQQAGLNPIALFFSGYQAPENYTALILDARHLQAAAQPGLNPALCSDQHCLAPAFSPSQLQNGWLHYATDLENTRNSYLQQGQQPLVLKLKGIVGGQLKIDPFELELLQQANAQHHFLEAERVTLVW